MSTESGLPSFLSEIKEASTSKGKQFSRDVKFINMRSFDNHGTIKLVPFDGANGETAIKYLKRIATVAKQVSGTKQDGTPYVRTKRLRFSLDPTTYGELSESQMKEFETIRAKIEKLVELKKGADIKSYTLIQGYVVEHLNKEKKPILEKSVAVYSFASKKFDKALNSEFERIHNNLGGYDWVSQLVNNKLTDRKRFLDIFIEMVPGEGGYNASVTISKFDEDTRKYTGGKDTLDLTEHKEILDQLGAPANKFFDLPVDGPLWDQDYISELHTHVNSLLNGTAGESPIQAPEISNAQVEDILNKGVDATAKVKADSDDEVAF